MAMRLIERASPNFDNRRGGLRPELLVMHYTGMVSAAAALARLVDPAAQVSCHYLVAEDGEITQLVAESHRAWHAGAGFWRGRGDVNSRSIGIEIVNPGHEFGYRRFPAAQIQAVAELSLAVMARHGIAAAGVIGHSDLAQTRKLDPGELFPWPRLAEEGVGLYPPLDLRPNLNLAPLAIGAHGEQVAILQMALANYGWSCPVTEVYDSATWFAVVAFQRHFRPVRIDGVWDNDCAARLEWLAGTA
ncbi:MAG: N-acetylmuramoyl-L-alanine amidase [Alphaproteobacteria bacterium]|nr:N-acetylmuramoyl-L-alanine amidase [Alphaproteobacteria bacterium]